jgi:membrane protease YdiL (CAAX protease family)
MVGQWTFALLAFAIWASHHRPLAALRLVMPEGWRLGLGIGLVGIMLVLTGIQLRSVLRIPRERLAGVGATFGAVRVILPHTRREYIGFLALSVTAGFCEELLYRGYLAWALSPWLGDIVGMVVVVIVFGVGHSYQGVRGVIKATLAGAVMGAIVLGTGSLIPAMIVHGLIDAGSGTVAWMVLRE